MNEDNNPKFHVHANHVHLDNLRQHDVLIGDPGLAADGSALHPDHVFARDSITQQHCSLSETIFDDVMRRLKFGESVAHVLRKDPECMAAIDDAVTAYFQTPAGKQLVSDMVGIALIQDHVGLGPDLHLAPAVPAVASLPNASQSSGGTPRGSPVNRTRTTPIHQIKFGATSAKRRKSATPTTDRAPSSSTGSAPRLTRGSKLDIKLEQLLRAPKLAVTGEIQRLANNLGVSPSALDSGTLFSVLQQRYKHVWTCGRSPHEIRPYFLERFRNWMISEYQVRLSASHVQRLSSLDTNWTPGKTLVLH